MSKHRHYYKSIHQTNAFHHYHQQIDWVDYKYKINIIKRELKVEISRPPNSCSRLNIFSKLLLVNADISAAVICHKRFKQTQISRHTHWKSIRKYIFSCLHGRNRQVYSVKFFKRSFLNKFFGASFKVNILIQSVSFIIYNCVLFIAPAYGNK